MSGHFDEIYAAEGAPSVPPEMLLKGKVLQALCTLRSDRQLCARLQTDLLFRWFVDLPLDERPFDASRTARTRNASCAKKSPICFSVKWWNWPGGTAGSTSQIPFISKSRQIVLLLEIHPVLQ